MLFFVFILVCVPIAEAFLSSSSSYKSFILRQTLLNSDEVLEEYKQELIALRGTPELVDRLENLASKYPGLETNINLYRTIYPFPLDQFQEDGLTNLISGKNVIVSTPTGSGKTIVSELAIYFALMMGLKVAYTTPLKALSNQKFQDFSARYGGDRVGLLTGDIAINRGAAITVMTTEVFRNMVYDQGSQNQLSNLFMVCFDEFHYMNDPERGTVWEESVISCPSFIRILALSATMGNVDDIKGWFSSIHGPTELVLSDHRPVPLRYLYAQRHSLLPLFRDPNAGPGALNGIKKGDSKGESGASINPSVLKIEDQAMQGAQMRITRSGRPIKAQKSDPAALIPKYSEIAEDLQALKLLPAIVFIFSRVGCEENAKTIMQGKIKLLTNDESAYVTQAINAFSKAHPEIPIAKSNVQMLRAGVGVHHAGLIPVWKAFIEDLFNANKIKILFATETLAAGVNMPARTTIISSVTKRIASEVIKLKTSQLLQMAGRAGRRGKDTEGTVVVMRNRFEDVKVGHKILTSPVDGIKSHFKISYGLAVKLLETRTVSDCRALIERGFGSYVLQKRVKKKETDEMLQIEVYRTTLQKYTLRGARDFFKLLRRVEKERSNERFLLEKLDGSDQDLVEAIADYMPLGVGVKLRSGDSGFFLGDVKWGQDNSHSGFGIVTQTNKIFIVRKEHISAFAEPEESIPARRAKDLLDLVVTVPSWSDELVAECTKPMLVAEISKSSIQSDEKFATAMEVVNNAPVFPAKKVPGSIIKQRMLIEELEIELAAHPVVQSSEQDLVIAALRHASAQKDPIGFVNNPRPIADPEGEREVFAWTMFQSVLRLLEKFDAMDENSRPTDFGRLVGSLSGDNELWAALAIQRNNMKLLNCAELAAVMCGLVTDGYKAKNAYFRYKPSNRVLDIYTELETLSWDVRDAQIEQGIEFPIHLCTEMGGLVESWVNGLSWRELCKDTNMDQGDLCRTFRRTVELLKQIPLAYGVPTELSAAAAEAVKRMNRFPVADAETDPLDPVLQTRVGAGVGFGNFEGTDAVSTEDESERLAFVDSLFDDDEEDKDRVEVDDSTELPGGFDIATLTDNEEENKDAEVNFEEIFKGLQKSSKDGSKINSTEGAKTFARRYSNFVDRKRLGSPDPTQPSVSEILGQDLEDFLNQINDADGK